MPYLCGLWRFANAYSLQKIEVDKFARANLEYMLITVDDDMKLEALPQTNHIKSIVTLEDQIDLERKGQQSFQGVVYARLIAFGNERKGWDFSLGT